MNQVSWSRILQRAADEGPGDGGADVINFQDHVPSQHKNYRRRERAGDENAGLESELRRALDRTARRGADYGVPRMPSQQDRIFTSDESAHRSQRDVRQQRSDLRPEQIQIGAAVNPALSRPKTTNSGSRNLLAISISAAVIGLAYYQISGQWSEQSDTAPAAQLEPESRELGGSNPSLGAASPSDASAASRSAGRPAKFDGNRLDLRPSVAKETAVPNPEQRPVAKVAPTEIKRAEAQRPSATENTRPVAATIAVPDASDSLGAIEKTMLKRGRELVQLGDFAGARLIFEHLAEQDSAVGAFSLAQTYDPQFFGKANVYGGVAPNEKLAAKWYARAAELSGAAAGR